MRGALITFEGVEGSGKSSQCRLLAEALRRRGLDVAVTSEPDGTPLGCAIRGLFEAEGTAPTPLTQVFLFMAARQQHVAQVIRPALARGALVLCDRYVDATMAYQGFAQGIDLQTIRDLNALATGGVWPDLTLLLDLEPEAGIARIGGRRLDAFERMDVAFHRRVRDGYLEIARMDKTRVAVVPGAGGVSAVHAAVTAAVDQWLARRSGLGGD
jgi:dTMP kinase